MKSKIFSGLVITAFLCSTLFFLTSCAKKQVQMSEGAPQAETKGVTVSDTEAAKAREAERQARLKELSFTQRLTEFNSQAIYFDFDKSELRPQAKEVLKDKADFLRDNPQYSVRIEGHCDERGTNEYNLALGERRAHAAKKYLMALGVAGDRISTISYGEERPADPRSTPEAWDKNRRDEFEAIKTR
jgi:peptidoglycan-associated lipoprotein